MACAGLLSGLVADQSTCPCVLFSVYFGVCCSPCVCVCLSVRVRLCVCSNKGCQEHLQKVYTAMAGAMISAAVGAVAYFFVPLGVSGLESACGGGGVRGWVGVGSGVGWGRLHLMASLVRLELCNGL